MASEVQTLGYGLPVVLLLLSLAFGAVKAYAQIYIDSYRFGVVGPLCFFDDWNTSPYDSAAMAQFMTELNCIDYPFEQDSLVTFGDVGATSIAKWSGGVLAPNGKIYCVPFASSTVLVIDPSNNGTTTFGDVGATSVLKWQGGVLAPNGKIYCVPRASSTVLSIGINIPDIDIDFPLSRHLNKF